MTHAGIGGHFRLTASQTPGVFGATLDEQLTMEITNALHLDLPCLTYQRRFF